MLSLCLRTHSTRDLRIVHQFIAMSLIITARWGGGGLKLRNNEISPLLLSDAIVSVNILTDDISSSSTLTD
jgi:hypothetical protein